jgi:hypothetical protein
MQSIFKQLRDLSDEELLELSEALDNEVTSRSIEIDDVPDSARRRAVERNQSYRRRTGSAAPPVRYTGLKEPHRKRKYAA